MEFREKFDRLPQCAIAALEQKAIGLGEIDRGAIAIGFDYHAHLKVAIQF